MILPFFGGWVAGIYIRYLVGDLELLALSDVLRLCDCGLETGDGFCVEWLLMRGRR